MTQSTNIIEIYAELLPYFVVLCFFVVGVEIVVRMKKRADEAAKQAEAEKEKELDYQNKRRKDPEPVRTLRPSYQK